MRSLRFFGIFLIAFSFVSIAVARENNLGIRDSYRVTFNSPFRIGETLLPAGEYTIRHTMEGQDHVMVFHAVNGKVSEVKAQCKLVALPKKADRNETSYARNAANELVLRELTFRGDSAKHVF